MIWIDNIESSLDLIPTKKLTILHMMEVNEGCAKLYRDKF